MARRGYPPESRRRVVDVVEGGRKVSEVAAELEVSEQTIYTWRRQARIDAGLESGLSTAEHADLAAAKRRIRELETEVAIHRRATELLRGKTEPKGRTRRISSADRATRTTPPIRNRVSICGSEKMGEAPCSRIALRRRSCVSGGEWGAGRGERTVSGAQSRARTRGPWSRPTTGRGSGLQ